MHPTWHHVDSHEFCDSTFVPPSFAAANDSRMKTAIGTDFIVITKKVTWLIYIAAKLHSRCWNIVLTRTIQVYLKVNILTIAALLYPCDMLNKMMSLDTCFTINVLFVIDVSSVPLKLRHLYKSRLKLTASELALYLDCFEMPLLFAFYSSARKRGSENKWERQRRF